MFFSCSNCSTCRFEKCCCTKVLYNKIYIIYFQVVKAPAGRPGKPEPSQLFPFLHFFHFFIYLTNYFWLLYECKYPKKKPQWLRTHHSALELRKLPSFYWGYPITTPSPAILMTLLSCAYPKNESWRLPCFQTSSLESNFSFSLSKKLKHVSIVKTYLTEVHRYSMYHTNNYKKKCMIDKKKIKVPSFSFIVSVTNNYYNIFQMYCVA